MSTNSPSKTSSGRISEALSFIHRFGESQKRLAEISGVSRVQISRIANGHVTTVSERTLRLLRQAVAGQQSLSSATVRGNGVVARARYREMVEEQLGKKSFVGLGFPDLPPQKLESVFVMPEAVRHQDVPVEGDGQDQRAIRARVARDQYAEASRGNGRLHADEVIHAFPRLVILGCPGAGKTTFMQYSAVMTARGSYFQGECLPIFIRLPEFASAMEVDPQITFLAWIKARFESHGGFDFREMLRDWAEDSSRQLLFLLDGLDEVPDEDSRNRLVETTRRFMSEFPSSRFCVTSRSIGFDSEPWKVLGFEVFRLLEYGDSQIRRTIAKWTPLLQSGDDVQVQENLQKAILENPRVRQIASNPLILTALIFLYRSRNYVLPNRRVDLFEKVAEVFLETWEASKRPSGEFSETLGIDLDARDLEWLVADLALQMQRNGLVTAKRWWIEQCWHESLTNRLGFEDQTAKDATARLLRFVSGRTGVFEERSLDLYAFSHRTLQEYFAAVGLINEADSDRQGDLVALVRPFLFQPDWNETVRLVTARITPSRAERLIRVILDDPDPSGRFLYRGPLLALRCLLDGATIANRHVVSELFHSMDQLGASRWLGITMECMRLLRQFNDSRYAAHASLTLDRILDAARKELSSEEVEQIEHALIEIPDLDIEQLSAEFNTRSAIVNVPFADGSAQIEGIPNFKLMKEDAQAWRRDAVRRLFDPETADQIKHTLIEQMAIQGDMRVKCFPVLARFIDEEPNNDLKAHAVSLIRRVAKGNDAAVKLLRELLHPAQPEIIRSAAAWALGSVVESDPEIRQLLHSLFFDVSERTEVRRNAALALADIAEADHALVDSLLHVAANDLEESVRLASLHALRNCIATHPRVREEFLNWLQGEGIEARVASRILARLLSEGKIPWDQGLCILVEDVMRRVGTSEPLGQPGPEILSALKTLLESRDSRGGISIQQTLETAFSSISSRLNACFVFGSVARNEQSADSDIDVMLIGDVTMELVTPLLKNAERILGKQINPTIYSVQRFRDKLREGNHFLTTVVREPKIPISVAGALLSEKELNDELGTMAPERLVGK
jgi:hypothetical protein